MDDFFWYVSCESIGLEFYVRIHPVGMINIPSLIVSIAIVGVVSHQITQSILGAINVSTIILVGFLFLWAKVDLIDVWCELNLPRSTSKV